jgi:hypothetical protein
MATLFVPQIAEQDYESIRRLLNRDIPDTYDKWLNLIFECVTNNQATGHISETIDIDPNEFGRYLRATGAEANLQGLRNFAFQKGTGHKY